MPKSELLLDHDSTNPYLPITELADEYIDIRFSPDSLIEQEQELYEAAINTASIILDKTDSLTKMAYAQSEGKQNIDTERMRDYINVGLHLPSFYIGLGAQFTEYIQQFGAEDSSEDPERSLYLGYRLPPLIEDIEYWKRTEEQNKLGYFLYKGEKRIVWNTVRSQECFFDRVNAKGVHGLNVGDTIKDSDTNTYYLWLLTKARRPVH